MGVFFSIAFYIATLFSIFYYISSEKKELKRYSKKKENILEITIVEKKSVKRALPKKERVKKKVAKTLKKSVVKKSTQKPKKISIDAKSLFKDINISAFKEKVQPKAKNEYKSRLKESTFKKPEPVEKKKIKSAQKIVKDLSIVEQKPMVSYKKGEYNEYMGEVTEILDSEWQQTLNTVSGSYADILVRIDNKGVFSFKIDKLSYNDSFNSKLKDFLLNMSSKSFPPFPHGEYIEFLVTFRDE